MANETSGNGPKRTGIVHLKNYFGLKEGQKAMDFAAEVKALSDEAFFALRDGIVNGTLTY